jgi:2-haloacid dehalogenase
MSHPPTASIKVLAFDVFGTVVDWRSSVIAEGEQLGKTRGLSVDWTAFADAWRAVYRPSLDRVQKGELPWTKLDVLHRTSLEEILKKFSIGGLREDEKDHFNRIWHRLKPWPDSVAGLKRLKSRFVITTLSNGNISLLTNMAKHAGLPWDCILSAENVHHYKPDPEIYRLVPDLFDLKPDQAMLVAAHENDLQSAQKYGLRTAYVHRPLEHGPGKAAVIPSSGKYDFVAKDFLDLADQMGI